jgi:hypothetical protein
LSQQYPNSFSQNTKEPPSSSWIGMRARNFVALFYTNTGFPSADASTFRLLCRVGNAICAIGVNSASNSAGVCFRSPRENFCRLRR